MTEALRNIAPGVHVAEAPQRFMGMQLGARMTVLQLGDDLLVHSPLALPPESIAHLGHPRWVLAPNLLHHLYVGAWAKAGLETWGAPGLPDKRTDVRFDGIIEAGTTPFGDDVVVLPLQCFPTSNEVVLLHRPSRTLVVTDLVFNLQASAPPLTKAAMWALGGYPGCCSTVLERFGMNRTVARRELASLADWDFDRLIMAHGAIIETGGKAALLDAFRWLGMG